MAWYLGRSNYFSTIATELIINTQISLKIFIFMFLLSVTVLCLRFFLFRFKVNTKLTFGSGRETNEGSYCIYCHCPT